MNLENVGIKTVEKNGLLVDGRELLVVGRYKYQSMSHRIWHKRALLGPADSSIMTLKE